MNSFIIVTYVKIACSNFRHFAGMFWPVDGFVSAVSTTMVRCIRIAGEGGMPRIPTSLLLKRRDILPICTGQHFRSHLGLSGRANILHWKWFLVTTKWPIMGTCCILTMAPLWNCCRASARQRESSAMLHVRYVLLAQRMLRFKTMEELENFKQRMTRQPKAQPIKYLSFPKVHNYFLAKTYSFTTSRAVFSEPVFREPKAEYDMWT